MHDVLIGAKLVEIFDYRKTALEKIFVSRRHPINAV
jgi:hypothetical protein